MRFPWVIVGNTGYDVEEIDHPRTHEMECPSCGKHVRFVEKELIKNLRVFGVPLVGVEKGRRVFECPHCRVCVEPPEGGVAQPAAGTETARTEKKSDPQIDAMEARIRKLDDEIWLWNSRAKIAADKGARDLEFEALEWKTKAEREASALRERIAALRTKPASEPPAPAESANTKTPAIVARKGGEIVDRAAEDEFAALKAKLARKQTSSETNAADVSGAREAVREPSGSEHGDAATPPAQTSADTSPAVTNAPAETSSDEESFAALKAKLARKREGGESAPTASDADYRALREEIANEPKPVDPNAPIASDAKPAEPPGTAPTPPTAPPAGDDDDDPVAALKRKLRGK